MRILIVLLLLILACSQKRGSTLSESIPEFLIGQFEDDYELKYSISDSLFIMEEQTKIHITQWNFEEQYFIGQNDSLNQYDPLLFSRIDWTTFENMEPFKWGFCMSAYNSISADSAIAVSTINREVPKTGCNGHPFSRMKRINN